MLGRAAGYSILPKLVYSDDRTFSKWLNRSWIFALILSKKRYVEKSESFFEDWMWLFHSNHNDLRIWRSFFQCSWGFILNFVEVMALYRAVSAGRFRCSGISPVVKVDGYTNEGYVLVLRKNSTEKLCLRCIRKFVASKPSLQATEDQNYLTIHSTWQIKLRSRHLPWFGDNYGFFQLCKWGFNVN